MRVGAFAFGAAFAHRARRHCGRDESARDGDDHSSADAGADEYASADGDEFAADIRADGHSHRADANAPCAYRDVGATYGRVHRTCADRRAHRRANNSTNRVADPCANAHADGKRPSRAAREFCADGTRHDSRGHFANGRQGRGR